MKKIALILMVICSLFLIISGIIIPSKINSNNKEYKELKWDSYFGEKIPSDYDVYSSEDYKKYNYNLNLEKNKSFDISLPSDLNITGIDTDVIKYANFDINLTISKTYANSIIDELEVVKQNNDPLYEKTFIESTRYDDNLYAIIVEHAKYNGDKTTMMFGQETRIYLKSSDKNEYIIVNIMAYEKRISKDTLSKIINSITVKKDTLEMCSKNKCQINFNKFHKDLNNNFSLSIDKNKYILDYNEGLSGIKASFVTKEYYDKIEEENSINSLTRITLKTIYDDESYLDSLPYQEEVEIAGKKIVKSYIENDLEGITQYKGIYVYDTNNKVFVVIEIDSRVDNVEKVINDFIKFKI